MSFYFVAECQWLFLEFIQKTLNSFKDLFPAVKYGLASVPSYPAGQLGFIVASTSQVLCESSCSFVSLYSVCGTLFDKIILIGK